MIKKKKGDEMHNLFSPDSKVMQGLSRAADLMLLNLCFLVTSVPVVTIGPSLAALYSVVFVMGTDREKSPVAGYFRAFRDNFGPATRLWLILLAVGLALSLDLILCSRLGGLFVWANVVFGILTVVLLLSAAMAFPLVSLFRNTTMGTLKNSLILGLGHLPRAAVILVLWIFPAYLLIFQPLVFFNAALLWIIIYFSFAAYLSGLLLRKVLKPYLPEDEMEETT